MHWVDLNFARLSGRYSDNCARFELYAGQNVVSYQKPFFYHGNVLAGYQGDNQKNAVVIKFC